MMRYMVLWDCEDAGYTSYRFVAEGENCPECDALDGQVFPISEASSGENLAPMHPNCDCGAEILDRSGNAVLTIGGAKKAGDSAEKRNALTPLLRIPEDAGKLLREFWDAQMERTQNIKGPLSFLDWLTLGIPRGIWEGMEKRGQDMRDAPRAYSIGNWLTMGLLDTAKGALAPDEPLSLEHWLDSAAVAGAAAGAYELAKYAVGKDGVVKFKENLMDELLEETGEWKNADGSIKWPANDGFESTPSKIILQPGTKIDRYGTDRGKFAAPEGTPFAARSLAPGSENYTYNIYEIIKPLEVKAGRTAPWFGQPGGGIQYKLPMSMKELYNQGFIRAID